LDIVQKIWAPLRKLFAPPGDPSWLWACQWYKFIPEMLLWLHFGLCHEWKLYAALLWSHALYAIFFA